MFHPGVEFWIYYPTELLQIHLKILQGESIESYLNIYSIDLRVKIKAVFSGNPFILKVLRWRDFIAIIDYNKVYTYTLTYWIYPSIDNSFVNMLRKVTDSQIKGIHTHPSANNSIREPYGAKYIYCYCTPGVSSKYFRGIQYQFTWVARPDSIFAVTYK